LENEMKTKLYQKSEVLTNYVNLILISAEFLNFIHNFYGHKYFYKQ